MTHYVSVDEAKAQAETAKYVAQAHHFNVQAEGQIIDNRTAIALAQSAEIALGREQLKETWEGASNGRNRMYHFTDSVTADSVDFAVDVLNRWHRIDGDDNREYRFVICSNGGNVIHGMKLYSTIKAIAQSRPVVTVASGLCASMATVIHQAGTHRVIEPGCSYMIHDVSGEMGGSIANMQDQMEWMNKLNHHLHMALAEKSNVSIEKIAELSKRRDSWYMPDEVLDLGLADEIGFATA